MKSFSWFQIDKILKKDFLENLIFTWIKEKGHMRIEKYFGSVTETTPAVTLRKTGAKNEMLDLTPPE